MYNLPVAKLDASELIARTVGKRALPQPGQPPSAEARSAMTAMANYRTAVPKGVFFYRSHEEANSDWERWQAAAMKRATNLSPRFAMTETTRPATWNDLVQLAKQLNAAGARYALIGGYALATHGYNRFSEDLDILVDPSADNTPRWVSALATLPDQAAAELAGESDLFQQNGNYAIRINDEFTVDVMPAACGHAWEELAPYITRVEIEGVPIQVLSLEGLLLTKQGLRDKDKADAAVIRRALGRHDS